MAARKTRPFTNETPQPGADHLLVIRLSALGDVAMVVPVLLALVQTYPHLRITCLSREAFAPLFRLVPNTTLYPLHLMHRHKGLSGLYKLFRDLQTAGIHGVADLHGVLRTHVLKFLFGFTAVPFAQIDKGRAGKRALTSMNNKVFAPLKTTHERYADVFRALGFPVDLKRVILAPCQPLTAEGGKMFANAKGKKIGLAPFAAFEGKMYPPESMEIVIRILNESEAYTLFLFGGPEETGQLQKMADPYQNTVSTAGKLTFREQLALISNLDLMISMDSSNGHLAAIFGIPVITLWGVTHPHAGFAPFRQPSEHWLMADRALFPGIPTSIYGKGTPKGYEQAPGSISPEAVVHKVKQVLGQTSLKSSE